MAWLKALHISALLIWCAGLIYVPALLAAHQKVTTDSAFVVVRRASRFAHTVIVSPAGALAIGSGAALLFVADALHGWMFVKLAVVGVLVTLHLYLGGVVSRLSDRSENPSRLVMLVGLAALFAAILVILWLVLGEPDIPLDSVAPDVLKPGGLQPFLSKSMPI
jgi:uncharacterized membrane protein